MKKSFRDLLVICGLLLSILKGFSQEQPTTNTPPPLPNGEMMRGDRPDGPDGNRGDKKSAFIVKRLHLTLEETAKFLPLYKKYNDELMTLRMQSRVPLFKAMKDENDSIKIPVKDQNKLIENEMLLKQQEIDLAKKYNEEYKKIMSPMKVARLYQVEDAFVEDLLNSARRDEGRNNRRAGDQNQHPPVPPAQPIPK